jgi:hypothetical protein
MGGHARILFLREKHALSRGEKPIFLPVLKPPFQETVGIQQMRTECSKY